MAIQSAIPVEPTVPVIKAGQLLRVPKKLEKIARHRPRLNALAVWSSPGDTQVWMEVRSGGLLKVIDHAKKVRGQFWRKVKSPDGVVEGYALEHTLQWCDLIDSGVPEKKLRAPKTIHRAPQLFDWAYVGVDATHSDENLGQCISIEYDRLPEPDYLGLATFRMLDGRSRRAWLIHAQKTDYTQEQK